MKSILPCLEDGLTGGAQVNVPSQEVFSPEMYQKIKIGKYTWFFNTRKTVAVTQKENKISLEYLNKSGIFLREFDIALIENPDPAKDNGSYHQFAFYNGKQKGSIFQRINTLPTLYLSIKLGEFTTLLAREVLRLYPEIEENYSFIGSSWRIGEDKDYWIVRPGYQRDATINSVLAKAIHRTVAILIRERQLPINDASVFDEYHAFWQSIQHWLQYKEGFPPNNIYSETSLTGLQKYIKTWMPCSSSFLLDQSINFNLENLPQLAKSVWDLTHKLKNFNEQIKVSRNNNCLNKTIAGRKRLASNFIRSGKQRIRQLYGKEFRESFIVEEWIKIHTDKLIKMILDFQNRNPGVLFHIDHIIPLAVLPREIVIDCQSAAWHPCNLQILSDVDNINKGSLYKGKKYNKSNISFKIYQEAMDDLRQLLNNYLASQIK